MESLIIELKDKSELKLVSDMLKKMQINFKKSRQKTPNAETVEAIEAVRRGETIKCKDFNDLMQKLNS